MVEHGTENAGVDSSSLSLGTTYVINRDSTPSSQCRLGQFGQNADIGVEIRLERLKIRPRLITGAFAI